jgi:beta-glucosidase
MERVRDGRLSEAIIDRSVRRVLYLKFVLGLFEQPYVEVDAAPIRYRTADATTVARELARQAIVLLENDGVLPLDPARGPIAVVGPAADDPRLLQGDYSYPAHVEIVYANRGADTGSILPAAGGAFQPGPYFPPTVTPLAAIRALVGPDVDVRYAAGGSVHESSDADLDGAVAAARGAAVAIIAVGGRSGLLADCTTGEFRDATDLALTGRQAELIARVAATGTPTVVLVMSGRIHTLEDVIPHANALMWAAPLGEQGGAALADVVFGRVPPSGRLPISIPRHVGQIPVHHDHRSGGGRSQMLGDYIDRPSSPRYWFGEGRSYSSVDYLALDVDAPATATPARVGVTVENAGSTPITEVVQLYARDLVARVARPVRQLVGFRRVALGPGAAATVEFVVDPTQFAYYDERLRLVVEPGEVQFMSGPHSGSLNLVATLIMTGDERVVAPNDRVPTSVRVLTDGAR